MLIERTAKTIGFIILSPLLILAACYMGIQIMIEEIVGSIKG